MSKRKWPVGSFVPCSPRHLHCSPAHAEFVRAYREERERQWEIREAYLGMFNRDGQMQMWKENGGHLITFKDALKAQEASRERHAMEVDYELVPCTFCGAAEFNRCVKVRGTLKGHPADNYHAVRGYAYWASRRVPLRA